MADLKISQLTTASSITGTEIIPIIQGGSNKSASNDLLVSSFLNSGKTVDININGTIAASQLTVDQIQTSAGTTPTITSDGNLNLDVAGRVDITSGSLTLGRFTNTQRDNIPAINGTLIYNTTDNTLQLYANGAWLTVSIPQSNTVTITSTDSLTPNADNATQYNITALATNLIVNAPIGTPKDGQKLIIRLKDNNTSRTVTWNGAFRSIGISLPAATAAGKTTYVGFLYNQSSSSWDALAVKTEI